MSQGLGGRGYAPGAAWALMLGLWAGLAQGAAAQTLNEALANTYATNPTLAAARGSLRATNEGVPQALANWRPTVTVTGAAGKQHVESESSFFSAKQNTDPREIAIRLDQPLYRGGRTIAGTAAAKNDVRAARADLVSVEQTVLLNAATAYMDVWRDQAVLRLTINNERVIQRQLEATQDRFTVGELTRTDVAQAETRLAVARADRIAAQGDLNATRAVYEQVIGASPGDLAAAPKISGLPTAKKNVLSLAATANPDLLSATFEAKAARKRVRETIGELLPSLSLVATASRNEESTQNDSLTKNARVAAEISVPLYQQGAVSSRVREAKQIASQRRVEIEEERRRIEQEGVRAWESLQSARAQIRSFESGVRSAEIALEGVRQENQVGARTILDILDAEQELLDAKVNLVRSQRDEVVASFEVLSVIGRLTARDLALPVALYEPADDYRQVRDKLFGLGAPGAD